MNKIYISKFITIIGISRVFLTSLKINPQSARALFEINRWWKNINYMILKHGFHFVTVVIFKNLIFSEAWEHEDPTLFQIRQHMMLSLHIENAYITLSILFSQ